MPDKTGALRVKNANYQKVSFLVEKHLNDRYAHVCSCMRCISDITALALNYLPPHYYVEEERICGSPWVMIENAVVEAIERVRIYPHHENNDNIDRNPMA